jgi:hypothetical protein
VHNIDELKVFCQQYEDVYINEVNYNAYIYQ